MADTKPTDIASTSLATNELTTMASIILTRAMLAARAGQQFGGARDLYTVLGYKKDLAFADHYARFRRQNIARRIITSKSSATWRHAPLIHEDKDRNTDTPFEAAWKQLDSRVGALRTLKTADELSGIGRYGILLIGTRGSGTLEDPLQPGSLERRGESGILYLRAYHEGGGTN